MEARPEKTVRRPYQPPELVKQQPLSTTVATGISPGGDDDDIDE